MSKTILITRAFYDDATSYLFYYADLIKKEAEDKGISVIDLKRPSLTLSRFDSAMRDKQPQFIFFNAHGTEDTIYGDKIDGEVEVLIKEKINHHILDSKLVYARSCWAAASLGKACKGGCFIGYSLPFTFWTDERWSSKPLNDNTAKLFLESSNLIVSSLLKGNSAEEAVTKSINMSKKNILRLLKTNDEPGRAYFIAALFNNLQCLKILGNRKMKFE